MIGEALGCLAGLAGFVPRAMAYEKIPRAMASAPVLPTRFYGSVSVDPDRAGRDVGRIAEEVLQHLTTLRGAKVRLTLEVQAEVPDGASDDVQRVVSENCQTLEFTSHGFERT